MKPEEIDKMAEIAEEYDVFLYSDEVYARMIFDNSTTFRSPASRDRCQKRTIVANGFSKAFAMTGWSIVDDVQEKISRCVTNCQRSFVNDVLNVIRPF